MKNLIKTLIIFFSISNSVFAQVNQQKLSAANSYLEKKDYSNSLKLFRELRMEVDEKDSAFTDVIIGLSASLYYSVLEVSRKNDWPKVIELSNQLLNVLEDDNKLPDPQLQDNKYWTYKNLVVGYFGIGDRDKAKPYQKKLYEAYKKNQLPKGINQYYNFEKFVFNNQNVWGYEWFPELGDKETEGSFSKHIYYIYSRDSSGNDKDQLFTLQTVKVHKLENSMPDFVLTKRTYNDDSEQSETIWTYTFDNPIDYAKLHDAVVAFLNGGIEPDTKSIIKR